MEIEIKFNVPWPLTRRAEQLLTVLRTAGTWLNRLELARLSGKNKLSPHDIGLLGRMANESLIEVREVPSKSPPRRQFEYRAKAQE